MAINRRNFLGNVLAAGAVGLLARCSYLGNQPRDVSTPCGQSRHGESPRDEKVNVGSAGQLVYRFQPASVTRLQLTIG